MLIVVSFCAALLAGLLARAIKLPGGPLVGAVVPAAFFTVQFGPIEVHELLRLAVVASLGMLLGANVDRKTLRAMPAILLPATLAAALLIAAGVGNALLLRVLGIAPPADLLATSPGALSVLAVGAVEAGLDAPTVAMYHIVRIMLVIGLLPFMVLMVPRIRAERQAEGLTWAARRAGRREARLGGPGPGARFLARLRPQPLPSPRPLPYELMPLIPIAVGAAVGGLIVMRLGSGGLIAGTFAGATLVSVLFPWQIYRPRSLSFTVQVALGWLVGTFVTEETLGTLSESFVGAVVSAVLLIIAGVLIVWLLRLFGLAPESDVLATSPGALEVVAFAAEEHRLGPVQVIVFHTMRLVLVIVSLPFMLASLLGG